MLSVKFAREKHSSAKIDHKTTKLLFISVYLFEIFIFSYFHVGRISTTLLAKEEKILKRIVITI